MVQVVRKKEIESLFEGIPRLPMPASCRVVSNKVKEEPKDDDDDDICINDTRLPLQCPLSLSRIKTPAKGKHCSHQKCFDLEVILFISPFHFVFISYFISDLCSILCAKWTLGMPYL